jgi:uncharacterized membrane protein
MGQASKASRRARLWIALRARPRLLGSLVFGLAVYIATSELTRLPGATAALVGWNAGAILNVLLTVHMAWGMDAAAIQRRALTQNQGRFAILTVVVLGAAAVLLAVGTQLSQARDLHGTERVVHVLLATLTVVTTWTFMQSVFALHYAHDFYLARHNGQPDPLHFPGTTNPLYGDFFHFSCVIGVASQTADISFNGSALRPVGTVHCVTSFVFNTSLLAFTINVAAGVLT